MLARRPVNVNVAPAEVLETLFLNLQMQGRNSRVVRGEARDLAALVVESRPFTGHEDFLRRVVLPAAGLEELPSDAPYTAGLAFAQGCRWVDGCRDRSTPGTPWRCTATRSTPTTPRWPSRPCPSATPAATCTTWSCARRSTPQSGVERTSGVRNQVELIVPQRELLHACSRARRTSTRPCASTARRPGGRPGRTPPRASTTAPRRPRACGPTSGPTRARCTCRGSPSPRPGARPSRCRRPSTSSPRARTTAGRSPGPRASPRTTPRRNGRVMHFDHETRDPEGRYLPDETIARPTDAQMLEWKDTSTELLRCAQPRDVVQAARSRRRAPARRRRELGRIRPRHARHRGRGPGAARARRRRRPPRPRP